MGSHMMEYITPAERAAAMRLGAYSKFAEAGVPFSAIDGIVKRAVNLPSPSGIGKAVIALSVVTGIPIGIAAHVIGNKITRERGAETELETEAGYYRNATNQLQRGLQATQAAS